MANTLPDSKTGRNVKQAEANVNWEREPGKSELGYLNNPTTHPNGNPEPDHVKAMRAPKVL